MTLPRTELAPGYSVPRHIVGLWQQSSGHQRDPVGQNTALDAMEAYFEAGFDTFDCADIYTGVEDLLGRLRGRLGSRGERLQVHTKYVPDRSALASLSRADVEAAVHRSLRRLRCERLDLVQFAWWDYAIPGYVDAIRWLGELQAAGKIRLIGTTNFDVPRLRELAAAGVETAAHQVQYSLLDRRPRQALEAYLADGRAAMLTYGSLAGGFLSGRWLGAPSPSAPMENRSLTKYRLIVDEAGGWERYQELLVLLDQIAAEHRVEMAHVATAWVLEQPHVAATLVGMRDASHLPSASDAFSVSLTDRDRSRIRSWLQVHSGPAGDIFELEREPDGPHAAIMWTDLNSRSTSDGPQTRPR